jgi:hypothetical protein
MTTKAQLIAERDFLLARADGAGSWSPGIPKRWTGKSSNALVRYVFGGEHPMGDEYPLDVSDLAACYRTVYRLPDHLRGPNGRANELICRYRDAVKKRYDLAEMAAMLGKESKGKEG